MMRLPYTTSEPPVLTPRSVRSWDTLASEFIVFADCVGILDVVAAPHVRLHPEHLLRIAEVDRQLRRHGLRAEQARERLSVRVDDRVTFVDHMERDRAVVRVDDGLHRVAHVIERTL